MNCLTVTYKGKYIYLSIFNIVHVLYFGKEKCSLIFFSKKLQKKKMYNAEFRHVGVVGGGGSHSACINNILPSVIILGNIKRKFSCWPFIFIIATHFFFSHISVLAPSLSRSSSQLKFGPRACTLHHLQMQRVNIPDLLQLNVACIDPGNH